MDKNGLLLLSVLFVIALCSCTIKRQKESYATLEEIRDYVRGGSEYWTFYDKGKKYRVITGTNVGDIVGMKWIIIYDSLHPDINYILNSYKPVFTPEEKTKKTICIIKGCDLCYPSKRSYSITFEYHVNGRYYEGSQQIPPRKDTICYKIGDKFEGEYWQENPKRVIIYLDKPIK